MRICLATTEILGAHRNGGIGTATSHLALLLADAGHETTLLNATDGELDVMSLWSALYRRLGVRVVALRPASLPISPWQLKFSAAYYDYLQSADFDLIIFQDWLALGQACTTAKRAGLAFCDTVLAVNTHGSYAWVNEVAGLTPNGRGALLQIEAERLAIELADVVISPSQYLLDWMERKGWRLPAERLMIQNFLQGFEIAGLPRRRRTYVGPPDRRLTFFGRFERRKGVFLFLDALLAPPLADQSFHVSFLGRASSIDADGIRDWFSRHRPDLAANLTLLTDRAAEDAMDYLLDSRSIAVIPSLSDNSPCVIWECIENGVQFVSTTNGGVPELVADDVADRILVQPDAHALASKLRVALDGGDVGRARHRQSPQDVGKAWLDWLADLDHRSEQGADPTPARAADGGPTVLLIDAGTPEALRRRLEALCLQTLPRFEVVVLSKAERASFGPSLLLDALGARWIKLAAPGLAAALVAGAQVAASERLIVVPSNVALSPAALEILDAGLRGFPGSFVTGQISLDAVDEGFGTNNRREVYCGGPVCVGAVRNCFGEFPIGAPREAFSGVKPAGWLGEATTAWTLLAAWSLSGGHITSMPAVVAALARPSGAESDAAVLERGQVSVAYAEKLPEELSGLVFCDQA